MWFSKYEKIDGVDVLLGDDSLAMIVKGGNVWLKLKNGRIGTLLGVLHILRLSLNLISVSKMENAGVQSVFEKYACNMVWGDMVMMRVF